MNINPAKLSAGFINPATQAADAASVPQGH